MILKIQQRLVIRLLISITIALLIKRFQKIIYQLRQMSLMKKQIILVII